MSKEKVYHIVSLWYLISTEMYLLYYGMTLSLTQSMYVRLIDMFYGFDKISI